jgi:hypothetical protein
MTKFSLDSGPGGSSSVETAALLPPSQRDSANTCDLYAPGHLIHYKHQGDAVHSLAMAVRETFLDGIDVFLVVEDGRELHWRNHDPERLRRILELLRGTCVAYPDHHALRVGPYWFNCAAESDPWQDCRLSRAARSA